MPPRTSGGLLPTPMHRPAIRRCSSSTTWYGIDVADAVMQTAACGYSGCVVWMLDDAMHMNEPGKLKIWGFWNILGEERYGAGKERIRPWYYAMSLLCRYFPQGAQILASWSVGRRRSPFDVRTHREGRDVGCGQYGFGADGGVDAGKSSARTFRSRALCLRPGAGSGSGANGCFPWSAGWRLRPEAGSAWPPRRCSSTPRWNDRVFSPNRKNESRFPEGSGILPFRTRDYSSGFWPM